MCDCSNAWNKDHIDASRILWQLKGERRTEVRQSQCSIPLETYPSLSISNVNLSRKFVASFFSIRSPLVSTNNLCWGREKGGKLERERGDKEENFKSRGVRWIVVCCTSIGEFARALDIRMFIVTIRWPLVALVVPLTLLVQLGMNVSICYLVILYTPCHAWSTLPRSSLASIHSFEHSRGDARD